MFLGTTDPPISDGDPSLEIDLSTQSKEQQSQILKLRDAVVTLKKAQIDYDKSGTDYQKMAGLYEKEWVSTSDYNKALNDFNDKRVALERTKILLKETALTVIENATYITITDATQYEDRDGRRMMDFTIENTSSIEAAVDMWRWLEGYLQQEMEAAGLEDFKLTESDLPVEQEVQNLLRITDLRIWIENKTNVMIGDPFERRVKELPYGETYTHSFEMKEKSNDVTLVFNYLAKLDKRPVFLGRKADFDIVNITSLQWSQKGDLRSNVTFDLEMDRLAEDEKTFALKVLNLPESYRPEFMEGTQSVTQVAFTRTNQTRKLNLRVYLPVELPEEEMEKEISFFAAVGSDRKIRELEDMERSGNPGEITEAELERLQVGYQPLRLTPQGVPRMEIILQNLYFQIDPGEQVDIPYQIENRGTTRLADIRFNIEPPTVQWRYELSPDVLQTVGLNEKQPVTLSVFPPEDLEPGKYEVRIDALTTHKGQPIDATAKRVEIEVRGKTNLALTAGLLGIFVALILGVAVMTVRLSRR